MRQSPKKAVAVGLFVLSFLVLVPGASASRQAASGDTCLVTGSGATYTLDITVGAAQQYGFAFGAPGASITNAVIPGNNGTFTTHSLPPSTTGAWISDAPLTGGLAATLSISGAPTGPFRIVPNGASRSIHFDPVTCTAHAAPAPIPAFTVEHTITYNPTAGSWRIVVAAPEAGTVSATQPEPTVGTTGAKSMTAKPDVEVTRAVLRHAGNALLTVQPTGIGKCELKTTGSIKLKLRVTFDANNGKSKSNLLNLTLKK